MTLKKIAAWLLITGAVVLIAIILFIEKMSDTALTVGAFTIIAAGAFFLYLYSQRLSTTRRWLLLFLYIIPALVLLVRGLLKP